MTSNKQPDAGKPELSPEAIDFAKRMIALKWTKETSIDVIANTWQAGYTFGKLDAEEQAKGMRWVKASDVKPKEGWHNAKYGGDECVIDVNNGDIVVTYPSGKLEYNPRLDMLEYFVEFQPINHESIMTLKKYGQHLPNCNINQNWDEAYQAMADTPAKFRDESYHIAMHELDEKRNKCTCGFIDAITEPDNPAKDIIPGNESPNQESHKEENERLRKQIDGMRKDTAMWVEREKSLEATIKSLWEQLGK